MQKKYSQLKKSWDGYAGYDFWMSQKLNNAHLLLIATYHDLVPIFKAMLKEENYDLKNFYRKVEKYGAFDKEKRNKELQQLVKK